MSVSYKNVFTMCDTRVAAGTERIRRPASGVATEKKPFFFFKDLDDTLAWWDFERVSGHTYVCETDRRAPLTTHTWICLFRRPREGLFGLREWAGDSELCELVATEDGSADVKHPQVPTISPRRPRKRSFKRSVSAGTSSESDEAHDEDEFRSIKPRVSVESSDSEEAVVEAFAPSAPFVSATSDAPLSSAERGLRATGPFMPNWDDAGILLLLNAAEDIEVQERNGETSSKGGLAPEETEAEETTEGGKNATGKGMGVMGKSPGMTEATVDALSKKSAAVSGGNRKTAPPPPLSLQQQIISLILQQQQAQAQAREQPFMAHLDVVIQQLALRAGQLLATLGPHELTVQALMALAVACNSRGYVADTKLALNQLWDVVYARVFPGGMGVTDARLAELQIQFGAMVKRAMTDDSFLQGVC